MGKTPPGMEYAPGKLIVGRSAAMRRVFFRIERFAPSPAPVLITGETGTGKELVARALHHHSGRSGPFVAVNCASIPDSLFESEFFGHRRGAFTGAAENRVGWFEQAAGGTLFLDEIGEMPINQQAKLLRAIQEKAVRPVGATSPVPVAARIVAATNVDVDQAVGEGQFRRDLRDRLNVLEVRLPPLRERPADVPILIRHFLAEANAEEGMDVSCRDGAVFRRLERWAAGGSIRSLQNAIRQMVVLKGTGHLRMEDLGDAGILPAAHPPCGSPAVEAVEAVEASRPRLILRIDDGNSFRDIMRQVGKAVTDVALARHNGCARGAIHELGMSSSSWYRVRNS